MHLIECTYEKYAEAILAILNEAIVNSTALYDYKPRTPESMIKWFEGKAAGVYPVMKRQAHVVGLFLSLCSLWYNTVALFGLKQKKTAGFPAVSFMTYRVP